MSETPQERLLQLRIGELIEERAAQDLKLVEAFRRIKELEGLVDILVCSDGGKEWD